MFEHSFKDAPIAFVQARKVTVNVVTEPESPLTMELAVAKFSDVFPVKSSAFEENVFVVFIDIVRTK